MSLKRWMLLIGALTGIGMVNVFQQTTIRLESYRLGRREKALHELESESLWLKAKVAQLESPLQLADTMTKQRLELIAWSELPDQTTRLAKVDQLADSMPTSD